VTNGTYEIVDKQLDRGYVPQLYDGGVYEVSDGNEVIFSGRYDLPMETIIEEFLSDGSIEGEIVEFEGSFIVLIPFNKRAKEIILRDETRKELLSVRVDDLNRIREAQEGGDFNDFLLKYWWILLIILVIVVLVIIYIVRRSTKKK